MSSTAAAQGPTVPPIMASDWRADDTWTRARSSRDAPPDPDAPRVWAVPLDAPWLPEIGAGWLTPEERAAADRRPTDAMRSRATAARIALRALLGAALGLAPEALRFVEGEHGKPRLAPGTHGAADERECPSLDFNLSHSGALALVAIGARGRVGVDVEEIKEGRPFEALAARWFAEGECRELQAVPASQRSRAFYELWCCKEAVLKAWGTGFTISSRGFEIENAVAARASGKPALRRLPQEIAGSLGSGSGTGSGTSWQIEALAPAAGFCGALCWEAAAAAPPRLFRLAPPAR